jgi:hypothetical protein
MHAYLNFRTNNYYLIHKKAKQSFNNKQFMTNKQQK